MASSHYHNSIVSVSQVGPANVKSGGAVSGSPNSKPEFPEEEGEEINSFASHNAESLKQNEKDSADQLAPKQEEDLLNLEEEEYEDGDGFIDEEAPPAQEEDPVVGEDKEDEILSSPKLTSKSSDALIEDEDGDQAIEQPLAQI